MLTCTYYAHYITYTHCAHTHVMHMHTSRTCFLIHMQCTFYAHPHKPCTYTHNTHTHTPMILLTNTMTSYPAFSTWLTSWCQTKGKLCCWPLTCAVLGAVISRASTLVGLTITGAILTCHTSLTQTTWERAQTDDHTQEHADDCVFRRCSLYYRDLPLSVCSQCYSSFLPGLEVTPTSVSMSLCMLSILLSSMCFSTCLPLLLRIVFNPWYIKYYRFFNHSSAWDNSIEATSIWDKNVLRAYNKQCCSSKGTHLLPKSPENIVQGWTHDLLPYWRSTTADMANKAKFLERLWGWK